MIYIYKIGDTCISDYFNVFNTRLQKKCTKLRNSKYLFVATEIIRRKQYMNYKAKELIEKLN